MLVTRCTLFQKRIHLELSFNTRFNSVTRHYGLSSFNARAQQTTVVLLKLLLTHFLVGHRARDFITTNSCHIKELELALRLLRIACADFQMSRIN